MIIELFLFLSVLLVYAIIRDRKPSNMPPGPSELPFIGNNMPMYDDEKCRKLRKKHGDIITVRSGKFRYVIIFDYKMAKEILARSEVTGRPSYFLVVTLDEQKTGGVALSSGAQWLHDRRFFIRNLRNLGMGKSYLEGAINIEAQALVDDLMIHGQEPIEYPICFRTAPLNVIWQLVASKRYDLRSTEVSAFYDASKDLMAGGMFNFAIEFFPILKKLPDFIQRSVFRTSVAEKYVKTLADIVQKSIEEHEKVFDPNDPKDLIDEYLLDMKTKGSEEGSLLRHGALRQIIADAFDAGSDTIRCMLTWLVFVMAKFPDITKRVQKSIDDVVPRDRLVSLQDKSSLPLVEAYLAELYRYSCFVIMNVDRLVEADINFGGYYVPKDTVVLACISVMQKDPKYWTDPETFKLERFLDNEGKFCPNDNGFMLFGSGRRQCAGESLARMEVFLFASALLQNFDITVSEGEKLDETIVTDLAFRLPAQNKFIYKKRA